VNLCAPQRIHQFNHNGDDSKYLMEYNALATVPSRFAGTLVHESLRQDSFEAKCFRNMSISVKNAFALDRLAPRIDAGHRSIHIMGRRSERNSWVLTRSSAMAPHGARRNYGNYRTRRWPVAIDRIGERR
jgi:hypothetical protein